MSLQIQTIQGSGKVPLDLSLEISRKEILEVLEHDGWVIIENATDINSSERAKLNKLQFFNQRETANLSLADHVTGRTLL
ncbi:uncharacterized protein ATNIH1004_011310 [Aspergillus tanneri]|uniref:Uncharacterized protein n=1 Tax=Aspergillus tanneri TaxID=1220188 RepID=A0A5M9M9Q3_9EURO|nr:uncharacterized protein ATNIH1004_011310 [Aspergillus tanneri]KAA8642366.1 hypothetical protein ATNIH1004_011310 [Aspergillus tanneri]